MNLDQKRKFLIQLINHQFRSPTNQDKDREKLVSDLKKLAESYLKTSIEYPGERSGT